MKGMLRMNHRGKFDNARYEEIKQEVLYMFEETETDRFPINCFEIARKLCYTLVPYSKLNVFLRKLAFRRSEDGYSKVELDSDSGMYHYVIYYNDLIPCNGRIRWSIFHEIGHIVLGHHDNQAGNEQTEEDEANFFAKYAMCPPPLLNAAGCKCPEDVLLQFDTSEEFSNYAFDYFVNWRDKGPKNYLPYELQMLRQFHFNAA